MRPRTILVVDDDLGNLAVLEEYLSDHYMVMSATSGLEALQILDRKEFDVIIADQRMPQMSGSELLHRARKLYPDTVRMILTAFSDANAMLQAINEGQVYRFLLKPWDHTELMLTIRQALEIRDATLANRRLVDELQRKNEQLATSLRQLREAQNKLLDSARMATIGHVTSSVIRLIGEHRRTVNTLNDVAQATNLPPHLADRLMEATAGVTDVFHIIDLLHGFAADENWELNRAWCDVGEIADEAIDFCRLDDAFVECDLTLAEGSPPHAFVDRDKVKQVLVHLLRNASQATGRQGNVSIATVAVPGGVAVSVSDDGPGIPPEELEKIWDPFYSTREGGMGLGLQICRMVTEAHGGSIDIESTVGVGTVATVVLPIEPPGLR